MKNYCCIILHNSDNIEYMEVVTSPISAPLEAVFVGSQEECEKFAEGFNSLD